MAGDNETKDYLGMSDDDFLTINPPAPSPDISVGDPEDVVDPDKGAGTGAADDAVETPEQKTAREAEEAAAAQAETDKPDTGDANEGDPDPGSPDTADPDKAKVDGGKVDDPDNKEADPKTEPKEGSKAEADPATADTKDESKVEEKPVDHAAFYKQVMAPFKANGRTIELKTPEEAIRLMQMGAGYGRKLQDLQPALKTLKMLEKNDLLDEGKLSFLIDINNKNPDAIKKLIKDSGIDPLDLNIGDNVDYSPKSHSVSDKEMAFHNAVDDLQSNPRGLETLRLVNQTWDQESKSALLDQPEILGVIQSQRENGVYDQIAAEIDRQKLLGKIAPNTPFLQAYKLAGDHLQATNGFKISEPKAQIQNQSGDTPQPQVIATRTAAPKAQVQNGDKAAAAAPTKTSSSRKASATVNPLEMADDVFLKQFEGRL